MQSKKTQSSVRALPGLQGVFNFEQTPSSPPIPNYQLTNMSGYRVDSQSLVLPIWRRHHG